MSHLASIFILLHKIVQLKVRSPLIASHPTPTALISIQSCSGISYKSQALYLIVYVTRYLGTPSPTTTTTPPQPPLTS